MNLAGVTTDPTQECLETMHYMTMNDIGYFNDNYDDGKNTEKQQAEHSSSFNDDLLIKDHLDISSLYLSTHKLYKIWFNKEPDTFLSEQNKLRLIEFRSNNPSAEISLVYSTELLSTKTKEEVKKFLEMNNIISVDFNDVLHTLNSTQISTLELEMLHLAKEELNNFGKRGNGGGNPAAAADILRFSRTIIEKCGIYSDFDVQLEFDKLTEAHKVNYAMIIPDNNNDFIAFAVNDKNGEMHKLSLIALEHIQHTIAKKYQDFAERPNIGSKLHNSLISKAFAKVESKNIPWSLTEWRAQILKLDLYDILEVYRDYTPDNGVGIAQSLYINDQNLDNSRSLLESVRNLDIFDAIKLFTNIHNKNSLFDIESNLYSDSISNVLKAIQSNLGYFGIENELKDRIIEIDDFTKNSLESLKILLCDIMTKAKSLSNNELKNHYLELIADAYVDNLKYTLYKSSVMSFSGPEILLKGRWEFSPEANDLGEFIVRSEGQDGSWYHHKMNQ